MLDYDNQLLLGDNMNKAIVSATLMFVSMSAVAASFYKCTDASGNVSYVTDPCTGTSAVVNVPTSPKVDTEQLKTQAKKNTEADERISKTLAQEEKDRKIRVLKSRIGSAQSSMEIEMYRLSRKKSYAMNNLAGATYEQSISAEMQAVAAKYDSEIRSLQAEIDLVSK